MQSEKHVEKLFVAISILCTCVQVKRELDVRQLVVSLAEYYLYLYRVSASPARQVFESILHFYVRKTNKLICGTHFCNSCFVLCINETFPTSADKRYSHTAPAQHHTLLPYYTPRQPHALLETENFPAKVSS